jgi:hypothetical protein
MQAALMLRHERSTRTGKSICHNEFSQANKGEYHTLPARITAGFLREFWIAA